MDGRIPPQSCGSIRRPSRVVTPVSSSIAGVPGLKTWKQKRHDDPRPARPGEMFVARRRCH